MGDTIQIIILVVLVIGAFIALFQVQILIKQVKSQHEWNRRSAILNFPFTRDPYFRKVLERLDNQFQIGFSKPREIDLNYIKQLSENDYPEIMADIQSVLGLFSNMTTAIKHGVLDESLCHDTVGSFMIDYFRFFRQFIEDLRIITGRKDLYKNYQFYMDNWTKKSIEVRPKTDK